MTTDALTLETWGPLRGSEFGLSLGPWDAAAFPTDPAMQRTLVLAEVTALGNPPVADGRSPFSLVFVDRSGDGRYVPQRMYLLQHPALGLLVVFLVPIGPTALGMQYQAIFN